MKHNNLFLVLIFTLAAWLSPQWLAAQSSGKAEKRPWFEFGANLGGIAGNGIGNNVAVGGRATYVLLNDFYEGDLGGGISLDGEVNWLPVDKASSILHGGRAVEGLFGFKAEIGDPAEKLGVKLRSGFLRSERVIRQTPIPAAQFAAAQPARLGTLTSPLIEFGFVYEKFRPESHWGMRFDIGDTIVLYPDLPGISALKGKNNFQTSAGVLFRFPLGRK